MSLQKMEIEQEPATGQPVIMLVTRRLNLTTLDSGPVLGQLTARFDIRQVESPSLALVMSRIVQANGGRVVLLLSDMLSKGSEVIDFISEFSRDWPEAGLHLFDAAKDRVIFTEPSDPTSDRLPTVRIESNGPEPLDTKLVLRMVERYFPDGDRYRPQG